MNKNELVRVIADKVEFTLKDTTAVVDAMVEAITKALKAGEEVNIAGFGKFSAKKRAARESINPRTKEVVKVPTCIAPAFKASTALKDALNSK